MITTITASTAGFVQKIDALEKKMNSKIARFDASFDILEKSLFKSQFIFGSLLVLLFLGSQGILDVIFPGIFPVK